MTASLAKRLSCLPKETRENILSRFSPFEKSLLLYSREFMLRPEQIMPEDDSFDLALVLAGRAFGKTKLGGHWVRRKAESGRAKVGALIGPDEGEIRKYMVEGPSGIRKSCPPWYQPEWYSSKGSMRLVWPNGTTVECHSAEEAEYRGPNLDFVWWDEPAKCRWLVPLWENVQLALRGSGLGMDPPQILMTGTPLPLQFFRERRQEKRTFFVTGSSLDNADNLPKKYVDRLNAMGESRHAQQERDGIVLEDEQGTLFTKTSIDDNRIKNIVDVPERFLRVVISIDPADSVSKRSDETGVVAASTDAMDHLYVLDDKTAKALPDQWAEAAMALYERWAPKADKIEIIAESNKGGENVRAVLLMYQKLQWIKKNGGSDRGFKPIDVLLVRSFVAKEERAHPVSQLYKAGRVHHVGWGLGRLEQEMTGWIPGYTKKSPNGLDAMAQAAHHLLDLSQPIAPDNEALLAGVGSQMAKPESETQVLDELESLFGAREKPWKRVL